MQHVMIDLETLGTRPESIITSIGAVEFDFKTGELGREFYTRLNWNNGQPGRSVAESTIQWWLKQSKDAQAELTKSGKDIDKALADFKDWLPPSAKVWANGPGFDIALLEHAFYTLELGIPWKYYNVRCYRTIKMLGEPLVPELKREGTHHNALDDSKHQALCVIAWGKALMKAAKE